MQYGGITPSNKQLDTLAQGLGWFSLGLGALEIIAPRALDRMLGAGDHTPATRLFGLREIAAGLGILSSSDPKFWLWARVAGDALDLGALAPTLDERNPHRTMAATAFANVALITALDIFCAAALTRRSR